MFKTRISVLLAMAVLLVFTACSKKEAGYAVKQETDKNGYKYEAVENDPYGAENLHTRKWPESLPCREQRCSARTDLHCS